MADHSINENYDESLRKLELTDPVHKDILNALFEQLINNDAFLRDFLKGVGENIKDHGAVNDVNTDSTTAINDAITASTDRNIYVPPGVYVHTDVQINPVTILGPGRIVKSVGGTSNHPKFRRSLGNSDIITHMDSYTGVVNNQGYDGTRFYIMPNKSITSGGGGILKIFADDYFNGSDYRDFGIYFYADQNGDTGHYGDGVFWINSKANNYDNPDIAFSFQDGETVAGRFIRANDGSGTWFPQMILGEHTARLPQTEQVRLDIDGDILFGNGDGLRFLDTGGKGDNLISIDSNNVITTTINSNWRSKIGVDYFKLAVPLLKNVEQVTDTGTILNVSENANYVEITNSTATTINEITAAGGIDGNNTQTLTLLFRDDNTTIETGTNNIYLKGSADYSPDTWDILQLEYVTGTGWIEVSRNTLTNKRVVDNENTTLDVTDDKGIYHLGNVNATTISSITGYKGQEITLLFGNSNTTLQHSLSNIVLTDGTDFSGTTNDVVKLVSVDGSKWVEASRSNNPS